MIAKLHSKTAILSAALLFMAAMIHSGNAQPSLSPPVWSNDLTHAQLTLANCTNTTLQYILQTSTDLSNWTGIQTNFAVFTNQIVTIPTTNQQGFYQIVTNPAPIFQAAFVVKSNITFKGNNCVVDSFDSSNPLYSTGGLYDVTKLKANGSVNAGASIISSSNVQNANIYGKVMTGPGTTQTNVNVGHEGAVGDEAWNASRQGIEPGYWSGGFTPTLPDVIPPVGGSDLPPVVSNVITLNGGSYVAAIAPTNALVVTASSTLWVQTNYALSLAAPLPTNVSLILYVGTVGSSAAGNSLTLGGNENLNFPGYARNFQIYGLTSLTSISFQGNAVFVGTIFAPEATVSGGGGGNNDQETSGAIIANAILANGHWNFHYDESLATNGPAF
jgi:hypothetical protein